MPLVSVIIPAFNQGKYIADAINSIKKQTCRDWECIIVNDGSTDETREACQPFLVAGSKIQYIEHTNRGVSATRNSGIEASSGKYIQFLDADDVIDRTKLEKQLNVLSYKAEIALSYTDYFSSTDFNLTEPHPIRKYLSPRFYSDNRIHELISRWEITLSIPIHSFLFDARFFSEHQIRFDEELTNHEDWDCWMSIFRLGPDVFFINEKLAIYRIHTDSQVYDRKLMKQGYIKALRKHQRFYEKNSLEYKLLANKIGKTKRRYVYSMIKRCLTKIVTLS